MAELVGSCCLKACTIFPKRKRQFFQNHSSNRETVVLEITTKSLSTLVQLIPHILMYVLCVGALLHVVEVEVVIQIVISPIHTGLVLPGDLK